MPPMANEDLIHIGKVDEFPPGELRPFNVTPDERVVVVNLDGMLHAFSNYCTHIRHSFWVPSAGAIVSENEVTCWVHGSTYDMRTGDCIWGPGYDPLPLHEVRIEGDDVFLSQKPVANIPID